jgi:hypothetical protein
MRRCTEKQETTVAPTKRVIVVAGILAVCGRLGVDYTVRFGWRFLVRQTVCRKGMPTNVVCLGVKRFVGHKNAHRKRTV